MAKVKTETEIEVKDISESFVGINPLASVFSKPYSFDRKQEYDDIVDDSNFKRSSELKRDMLASGNIGAGEKGVFDYEEGVKITPENIVSDVEIALRSGRLDKADIQVLTEQFSKLAEKSAADVKAQEALEAEKQAQTNRTKALDMQLGVNQD